MKEKTKHSKRVNWRVLALVLGLVLLAGAAGVGLRWWLERSNAPAPLAQLPETVNDIQNLRLGGDKKAADKKIADALADKSLDDKMRAEVYIQQGNSLVAKKDYKGAIEAYKAADGLNPTRTTAWLLGDMYRNLKDNEQAIAYYKKAIERVPAGDPLADNDTEYLQHIVSGLESKQ